MFLIIFSRMLICSMFPSSIMFYYCKWTVDTPKSSLCIYRRYAVNILKYFLSLSPYVLYDHRQLSSSSSLDIMTLDARFGIDNIMEPPGLYIDFHGVIVSYVYILNFTKTGYLILVVSVWSWGTSNLYLSLQNNTYHLSWYAWFHLRLLRYVLNWIGLSYQNFDT